MKMVNILKLPRSSMNSAGRHGVVEMYHAGHPNGLTLSHLALKVQPQETHSIVLKKKVTTRY
jgi:hypothetical protein